MSLQLVLAVAFGSSLLTYILGHISTRMREGFAVIVTLAIAAIIACLDSKTGEESIYFSFLGLPLLLRINTLSWFFGVAVSALTSLSVVFSLSYMRNEERTNFYYAMLLLVNSSMLGIVFSGDLLSLFVFWEIMSWSTFLLISYNRGLALMAGMKYIIFSIIGSMAMLVGILSLYTVYETLNMASLSMSVPSASSGYLLFLLIIFGIAFGIKNAVMPLHTWLPDAYAEAPSPFTAVLSGMLTRMGMYGLLLIMYVIVGAVGTFNTGSGNFNSILSWLGAITIVIPTFIAMLQNDAKKLLAWHGIGQGGYMVLGIAYGTSLGLVGGIFHTLNHAIYIVLLFMTVAAVQYRTGGERDLNSLGGLIKKMPIAFLGSLLGISGLIGLPLTNGFVSKWLIYKTLILEGSPFLAFAALIGTWGTILSVYKFLHNIFLGQLATKFKDIKQAPFSMQLPIVILSVTVLLFGILPGIPLKYINAIVVSFGFESLNVTLWGITSETGTLNTINIFAAVVIACVMGWLLLRASHKSTYVSQEDTYAAGAAIPRDKYHYTVNFYNPLYRMITPYLKDFIDAFYIKLAGWTKNLCNSVRKIYTGYVGHYVMYIVFFLAVLIFIQLKWSLW
ncbi:NADH dehydrogenase subunit [candidate division KSB1 bacterium]|nr:NADH dehydrogenase subunit [candidate division KSB1 bacterium]